MDGILIVDKPAGWTSFDVVNFVKKRFKIKHVGHTGTLDPMALGVLVLLLGKYTKLAGEFIGLDKEYETVLTLGVSTDTADSTGKVLVKSAVPGMDVDEARRILSSFTGEIQQVPPMFSAVKINGRRLYDSARKGEVVSRKARRVFIRQLEMTSFNLPDISMRIVCSKGTYIRTLCEDIARQLGGHGHMSYLRRTKAGAFNIEQAVNIERLKEVSQEGLSSLIFTANVSTKTA